MSLKKYAQFLGRRGGTARARKLAPARRREIASSGGAARAASLAAAQRVVDNFIYLEAVEILSGGPIVIETVAVCTEPLPGARRSQART
jgi:hypothetical protein